MCNFTNSVMLDLMPAAAAEGNVDNGAHYLFETKQQGDDAFTHEVTAVSR
jgi:hypothetical protein